MFSVILASFDEWESSNSLLGVYAGIAILSMIFCALIPASYYIYHKLRHHPSQLLAIISVFEFFQSYHALIWLCPSQQFIKKMRIDKIVYYLMFQL